MRNVDPEKCPHCAVSWLGEPIPDGGGSQGSHYGANMVLVLAEPESRNYYRCDACETQTPLGIWNYGYKPEFLAEVFPRGFQRRDIGDER